MSWVAIRLALTLAVFFAAFGFFSSIKWWSPWLTPLEKVLGAAAHALFALMVGAIVGLALGLGFRAVSLAWPRMPSPQPETRQNIGLHLGLAAIFGSLVGVLGLFMTAGSPTVVAERQDYSKCVASGHELTFARTLLSERRFTDAEIWAGHAIDDASRCGRNRDGAEGAAYATRGIAEQYQRKPDYEKDVIHAETLLEQCSAEKSHGADTCRTTLAQVEPFVALGSCNRALTDVATATSTFKSDPARAEFLTQRALRYNAHCKNVYAYAINAAARIARITARELEQKYDAYDMSAILSLKQQLERCVNESSVDPYPGDMRQFCQKMLEVAHQRLKGAKAARLSSLGRSP